jgi:outer membrane receptor protein involved in Fe transport
MKIWVAVALSSVSSLATIAPVHAQAVSYDIPAGDLKTALDAYARRSGVEIISKADDVRGVRSRGARGPMSSDAALASILAGTGFRAQRDATGAVAIVKVSADPKDLAGYEDDEPILVTGSRIRGASVTAPVVAATERDIRNTGQATLGEYVRSIPQSFAGGNNPGVVRGAQGVSNVNVNSTSSINLRGLGPDATLTLLNGHRLAYDANNQAVDISAIPLAAVDRVEIVADGASAIYGSDAVGGVANIILKRDYSGFSALARAGVSTDGGNEQQGVSLVGGTTWRTGGVIATVDYSRNGTIEARDRSYTSTLDGEQTLLPRARQFSSIVSGHQAIWDGVEFSGDFTLSDRRDLSKSPSGVTATPYVSGQIASTKTQAISVSPKLEVQLSGGWTSALSGTYARDRVRAVTLQNRVGALVSTADAAYKNETIALEIGGEGPLFAIGSEAVRLAVGAGYRRNDLDQFIRVTTPTSVTNVSDITASRDSVFAYGEIFAPIVSPSSDGFFHRFSLTAALRYENYSGEAEIATPKLGVILSPIDGLDFKASWGRSFKAPTLYQQYLSPTLFLVDASQFSPADPAPATVLFRNGGNPDLTNERATTWTATITTQPKVLPGLRVEASYFNVRYTQRVASPVGAFSEVFGTPGLQSLVVYNPSASLIESAIAETPAGLQFTTTQPFVPGNVIAIVDGRFTNISRQSLQGVDLALNYDFDVADVGAFSLSALASYLDSSQILVPGEPTTQLAGTIFDPSHWRGRGGLTWSNGGFTLNSTVSYISPLIDNRFEPDKRVKSFTTVDLTARYRIADGGDGRGGMEISVSALNVFNQKPRRIRTAGAVIPPYDSTNHSSIGRFLSVSVRTDW